MRTLAGTVVYISTAIPATNTVAGFNALAYTKITGVFSISDIEEKLETYTRNVIDAEMSEPRKTGTVSYSPVNILVYRLPDDAGQVLLLNSTAGFFSYKIIEPSGAATYFVAQTTTITDSERRASSLAQTNITLELSNRIVRA